MQNINLYKLMSKLYARPEVEDADIVSCMYEDDTLKGHAQRLGRRHRRAGRISSGRTVHHIRQRRGLPKQEPLTEGLHYDFEDDHDYKDGVEAIIKEAC